MRYLFDHAKKTFSNEQGIALVMALLLGMLGMLMVASLLLLVNTGTFMSGSKKRYLMPLASAHGGMTFFAKGVIQAAIGEKPLVGTHTYGGVQAQIADLTAKISTTGPAVAYANVAPWDLTMTFPSQTGPSTIVTSQLVYRVRGNSGTSSIVLLSGGVTGPDGSGITPPHIPYFYQIETRGKGAAKEKAGLSTIYAY